MLLEQTVERLLGRLRLAVIFGGDKSSPGAVLYETANIRPWKSYEPVANDIADSLRRIGFRHVELMPDDARLLERLRRNKIHMAWLNSGGVQGYNSAAHAASMLELAGVPYVGHNPVATTSLDNKHIFKAMAQSAGIPTARFMTWDMMRGGLRPDVTSAVKRAFSGYCGPFIVKPVSGRASLHVEMVEDERLLPQAIERVFLATHNLVLVEEYLPGREYCVAACGPLVCRGGRIFSRPSPLIFALVERVLDDGEPIFTSMDVRPIVDNRVRRIDPIHERSTAEQLDRIGAEVFLNFHLDTLIRVDIREDQSGKLYVLEANPKPDLRRPVEGITNLISAGLPEGVGYDDLILSLFAQTLDRLMTNSASSIRHIAPLLHRGGSGRRAVGEKSLTPAMNDAIANANVRLLERLLVAADGKKQDRQVVSDGRSQGRKSPRR